MIPLLILQIFLFPFTASWLMNTWVNSRRNLALQDVASHLSSTIQQLYFSLNHATMQAGTATYSPGLPPFIENLFYTATAQLRPTATATPNSSNVLDIKVTLVGTNNACDRNRNAWTQCQLGAELRFREQFHASSRDGSEVL